MKVGKHTALLKRKINLESESMGNGEPCSDYFLGALSVDLWITIEVRTAASWNLISETLEQGHLDFATGNNLAPAVPQKEKSQHMGLPDFPTVWKRLECLFPCAVRVLALVISSRELIKSLERRQQLEEKALGSFPLLC